APGRPRRDLLEFAPAHRHALPRRLRGTAQTPRHRLHQRGRALCRRRQHARVVRRRLARHHAFRIQATAGLRWTARPADVVLLRAETRPRATRTDARRAARAVRPLPTGWPDQLRLRHAHHHGYASALALTRLSGDRIGDKVQPPAVRPERRPAGPTRGATMDGRALRSEEVEG